MSAMQIVILFSCTRRSPRIITHLRNGTKNWWCIFLNPGPTLSTTPTNHTILETDKTANFTLSSGDFVRDHNFTFFAISIFWEEFPEIFRGGFRPKGWVAIEDGEDGMEDKGVENSSHLKDLKELGWTQELKSVVNAFSFLFLKSHQSINFVGFLEIRLWISGRIRRNVDFGRSNRRIRKAGIGDTELGREYKYSTFVRVQLLWESDLAHVFVFKCYWRELKSGRYKDGQAQPCQGRLTAVVKKKDRVEKELQVGFNCPTSKGHWLNSTTHWPGRIVGRAHKNRAFYLPASSSWFLRCVEWGRLESEKPFFFFLSLS